jgi:hypothetical protein
MVGITCYGAYIPYYRLNRFVIFNAIGWATPISPHRREKWEVYTGHWLSQCYNAYILPDRHSRFTRPNPLFGMKLSLDREYQKDVAQARTKVGGLGKTKGG